MKYFLYGKQEMQYLSQQDERLGAVIAKMGILQRAVIPDPFAALLFSIVSQQISSKAAATVSRRLEELAGEITPYGLANLSPQQLQGCGMSLRKAGYVKGIAEAALQGQVDFAGLSKCSDEEIIKQLSALHGVGVWTAEMLLIFSLQRPDIVSFGDLAIRRGMMKLYGLSQLNRQQFEEYRQRYSPYGTVASLYLWAIAAQ